MTAVGYDRDNKTGTDYWLLKNSWGPTWGKKGFLHLRRGVAACGIGRQMAVVDCSSAVIKFKLENDDEACDEEGCPESGMDDENGDDGTAADNDDNNEEAADDENEE